MSENISNELPVITSIDDLPETAIEELTNGEEVVAEEKTATTKAKASKASEPVAEASEAPAKPKRKRRTKAEIEAEKAAKATEAEG